MDDETPVISIVVPVYNTERYLPACLESIDAQGVDSFEVILVDDGSTDGSPSICDAYCDGHDRASVILRAGMDFVRRGGCMSFHSIPMTLLLMVAFKRFLLLSLRLVLILFLLISLWT